MKDQDIYSEDVHLAEEDFDIKRWIFRVSRSWYWFAGSLFICFLGAWLYLRYTNPIYRAVASVMIKDEKKGGDVDNSLLKELGVSANKLVENEIEVLKSYDLMEEVVKREKLNIFFFAEGRIRDIPLFDHEVPFQLDILNQDSIVNYAEWAVMIVAGGIDISSGTKKLTAVKYGETYTLDGFRFKVFPKDISQNSGKIQQAFNGAYFIKIIPVVAATSSYSGKLVIGAVSKQSSVVNLTIDDLHKSRAKVVLEGLIDIYNRQGLDDKNKVTANTIDFLSERLRAVAVDLQGVEGDVERFKSKNQITDISSDAQQFMEMTKDIDMQRAESQTRLNIVSALETDLLVNQENAGLVPSTLGIQEVSLASLVERHNSLVLEKERVEKNKEIGPQNPLLIDLQQQVQETRKKLLANVRNLKQAYQITLNDIARKDEQLRGRLRNIPQLEQKLVEIKRNHNVEEQLYAFLLQKREEAAVTLASNIPDSRTIVRAREVGQVAPTSKVIWIVAILIGLFTPLIVMLIRDFFNNKVGDASEVGRKTRVPLLGVISHISRIKSAFIITAKSRSVVAEQIRTLRTAIGFTGKGKDVKRILVSSSQPGDGKSFISINLAASYALLGKKTVIVELDLRKPHVGKYLGIVSKQGISAVLAGKEKLESVLVDIPEFGGNLSLLPAGYLPPNPAELISTVQMEMLFKSLSELFDYIIIDTPPFGLVTDAVLLQQYADITLAVVRQAHTNKEVYAELNQRSRQKPEHPLYTVLNGVGWKRRYQQGYGYGKYGHYGYGKGYFEEEK
ncbi:polysaccharide biosynthesis tyrosine autokinase [Terrimonas sp. NA20]|uniref:non-specific protein-tyrosine kinase n=1 Tax=Terrimonas ginsenosidimutans TaxID=2908004 RepID=A0ABS9L0E8_9BACT|nr:tyrosine-protein kinase [Terrimonas ginsenosidimutans]MCG2618072.1 polysaccharide biosynthesis tyrosine autokinase [Terrimonas ginsenosidimutans]